MGATLTRHLPQPSLPKGRWRREVAGGLSFSGSSAWGPGAAITGSLREIRSEPGYRNRPMDTALAATGLIASLIVYLAYKVLYRPDFGIPVRRKLMSGGLHVRRDQFAEVPLWWSNLQVQRAIHNHWKETLRRNALGRPGAA